jgi:hypothetical protein
VTLWVRSRSNGTGISRVKVKARQVRRNVVRLAEPLRVRCEGEKAELEVNKCDSLPIESDNAESEITEHTI